MIRDPSDSRDEVHTGFAFERVEIAAGAVVLSAFLKLTSSVADLRPRNEAARPGSSAMRRIPHLFDQDVADGRGFIIARRRTQLIGLRNSAHVPVEIREKL